MPKLPIDMVPLHPVDCSYQQGRGTAEPHEAKEATMSTLTATALHIPSELLAAGDVILDRHNKQSEIVSRFTDDETTAVCKTADGNWHYFPFGKEVRIAA